MSAYHKPLVRCNIKMTKRSEKNLYVFCDFVTRQDEVYKNHESMRVHVPNICVAQQVCDDCVDIYDLSIMCNTCGVREYIFKNDPVKCLVNLYIRERTVFNHIVCIAHNAGGFDADFILKELVEERKQILPQVNLNGKNIILLQYVRTKFIDSLNYFHMKLAALPETFDFPPSVKKGIFHIF